MSAARRLSEDKEEGERDTGGAKLEQSTCSFFHYLNYLKDMYLDLDYDSDGHLQDVSRQSCMLPLLQNVS